MLRFIVLTTFIFLLAVSYARADFYRWVDKDGKEFFTNDSRQIPQKYRSKASKIKFEKSRVKVGRQPAVPGKKPVKSAKTTKTAELNTGVN